MLEKKDIEELIQFQQLEQQANVKVQATNYALHKEKQAKEKWGKLYHIYKALEYLELKDLLNILSVSKQLKKRFHKKAFRIIFDRYGNSITQKQRVQLWIQLIQPVSILMIIAYDCLLLQQNLDANYKKLLEEFTIRLPSDQNLKHVEDVIMNG